MYTQFFGLREKPFSITPDPRYLYLSQRHADALAHLIFGVSHSGGFIQLTGEVGTGKTTLVRTLFEQLPDEADVALILNPELSVTEFLTAILQELTVRLPEDRSNKSLIDVLNFYLLAAHGRGRRTIVIVDEAQNLAPNILEQVRLLTNLETPKQKLLQIILIGQPELRKIVARDDMRQLAQRITGRYHLEPLDLEDTGKYIEHRLKVAGAGGGIFTPAAIKEIYRQSKGIPRIINVIADRALLAAYTQDTRSIDRRIVRLAAAEVYSPSSKVGWKGHLAATITVGVIAAIGYKTIQNTVPTVPTPDSTIEQATAMTRPTVQVVDESPVQADTPTAPSVDARVDTPTAAEPRSLASLLADPSVPKDTNNAFAALFELWGATFDASGSLACAQALQQQLGCWFQEGTLRHVRRLNRPAILSLIDANGDEFQLTLSRLDASHATFLAGGTEYSVSISDLSEYWYGDHLVLWQPGGGNGATLRPGARGDGVVWLRESLAKISGEPPPANPSDLYDADLEARVREFQRARRLDVDGIAGTQTQIVINTELDLPGVPALTKAN
jgi:general secretion pathway protein A